MKKLPFYIVCFVLSLSATMRVEAQNFTNGGFEITTITIPVNDYVQLELNSTWLVGWTVGGPGGGDLAAVDGTTELPPYQGSNWVVFGQGNTAAGASLSQSFATGLGDVYSVAFVVGQTGSDGSPSVSEIVGATGGGLISSNRCVPAYGVWTPFSFNFTATATNTTLTFLDTSSTSQGVDVTLDGVAVTQLTGKPVITISPMSIITNAGDSVTFTGGASTTASVQWYFGSTPITGATNTTFTVIAAPTSAGNYSAVFSNSNGTATSGVATLSLIPNLLTNGSFEFVNGTPIPPGGGMVLNPGDTWLAGWTVGGPGGGNMEVYNGDNDSLAPYDGQQFVVFNQGDTQVGGSLSQTVATTPGVNYSLSFVEAETEEGVGPMSVSAEVFNGAEMMIASNQFVAPSASWTSCQMNFTADSANTIITFVDTSSGTEEVDVAMDDAVLTGPTNAQPLLSITIASPNVILSWPSGATNFVLQTTGSLTGSWAGVTGGQQTINGNVTSWTGPLTTNDAFFRLKSQ
ncbi:MAG TPA: DUF642 domain-containing protein [Verrucomicrobiae bacterium]|nr:DUF642 domain-containing protein [Verrucomicrobiae bacterium]